MSTVHFANGISGNESLWSQCSVVLWFGGGLGGKATWSESRKFGRDSLVDYRTDMLSLSLSSIRNRALFSPPWALATPSFLRERSQLLDTIAREYIQH